MEHKEDFGLSIDLIANTKPLIQSLENIKKRIKGDLKLGALDKSEIDKFTKIDNELRQNVAKITESQTTFMKNMETYKTILEGLEGIGGSAAKQERALIKRKMKEEIEAAKKEGVQINKPGQVDWSGAFKKQAQSYWKSIERFAEDVWRNIKDIAKEAWTEIKNAATYSSSSLLFNREAVNTKLQYGLTDAQTYAFKNALEDANLNDLSDLALASNETIERFQERQDYYQEQYSKIQEQGILKTVQQFQVEFEDFNTGFKYEIMEFIANNKDTIMWSLETTAEALQYILKSVGWLVDKFAPENTSTSTSDILGNTISGNSVTIISKNSYSNVTQENQKWIEEANSENYAQVITALGGSV